MSCTVFFCLFRELPASGKHVCYQDTGVISFTSLLEHLFVFIVLQNPCYPGIDSDKRFET